MMRQQDEALDDVMAATKRLGRMGEQLGVEIEQHARLINEVRRDMRCDKRADGALSDGVGRAPGDRGR